MTDGAVPSPETSPIFFCGPHGCIGSALKEGEAAHELAQLRAKLKSGQIVTFDEDDHPVIRDRNAKPVLRIVTPEVPG